MIVGTMIMMIGMNEKIVCEWIMIAISFTRICLVWRSNTLNDCNWISGTFLCHALEVTNLVMKSILKFNSVPYLLEWNVFIYSMRYTHMSCACFIMIFMIFSVIICCSCVMQVYIISIYENLI